MKIKSLIFGLFLASVSVSAFSQSEPCGNEPFKQLYDEVECFSEGMARVAVQQGKYKKYGFIDRTGKLVIPIEWDRASKFKEGLVAVNNNGNLSGYLGIVVGQEGYFLDKAGKRVIDTSKYSLVEDFEQGFAQVINFSEHSSEYEKFKIGIIDKTGKLIIPQDYAHFFPISQKGKLIAMKYFPVQKRIYTGMIDLKNEILIPFEYDYLSIIHHGVLLAQKEAKWGQIDTKGNIVVPFIYDDVESIKKIRAW